MSVSFPFARFLSHCKPSLRAACCTALLLTACGGGGSGDETTQTAEPPPTGEEQPVPGTGPESVSAMIGAEGNTLAGPDGVQMVVPPGALQISYYFSVSRDAQRTAAYDLLLPPGRTVYAFESYYALFKEAPVTIRFPVPAGMANPIVLMASAGQDLVQQDAVIEGGYATVQRRDFPSRLVWGLVVNGCTSSPDANPDRCFAPRVQAQVAAYPAQALVRVEPHAGADGFAGVIQLVAPARLTFSASFHTWPSCTTARASLLRRARGGTGSAQTLHEHSVALQPNFLGVRGAGADTSFPAILLADTLSNGDFTYTVQVACERADGVTSRNGDDLVMDLRVPSPTASYGLSVNASGLSGSGLVLRNNGTDDLALAGSNFGSFTRNLAEGTPYNVTVVSAPPGQTCSVGADASGVLNANVTVAITCAPV